MTHRYMVHLSSQFHICILCWNNATPKQKGIWRSTANLKEQKRIDHIEESTAVCLSGSIIADLRRVMDIYGEIIPPLSV